MDGIYHRIFGESMEFYTSNMRKKNVLFCDTHPSIKYSFADTQLDTQLRAEIDYFCAWKIRSKISYNCFLINRCDRFKFIQTLTLPCALSAIICQIARSLASTRRDPRPFTSRLHRLVWARTSFFRSSRCRSRFSYLLCPRMDPRDLIFAWAGTGETQITISEQ